MKKLLGILVLSLLFFSNANAMPKWIGKAIKVFVLLHYCIYKFTTFGINKVAITNQQTQNQDP